MSEKRDLWVPLVLLLGGIGLLVWHASDEAGNTTLGVLAAIVGVLGAAACLPLRIKRGQGRVLAFGLGVLLILIALAPPTARTLPNVVAFAVAALAFLAPLRQADIRTRAILLAAAGVMAMLAVLSAMGVAPGHLVWLFVSGALYLVVQVLSTREREEEAPPPGPRVCVFGGSFDPFHRGHRMLAEAALRANDRLLVVVAGSAPHKFMGEEETGPVQTPFHHRVAMTRLGVERLPRTEVLEMEGKRVGPSYTVDTLDVLVRSHAPGTRFRLLLGADMLEDFVNWRDWQRILGMATLMVAARPGHQLEKPAALEDAGAEVLVLDVTPDETSSTALRTAIARGESVGNRLSAQVARYVQDHGLYVGA